MYPPILSQSECHASSATHLVGATGSSRPVLPCPRYLQFTPPPPLGLRNLLIFHFVLFSEVSIYQPRDTYCGAYGGHLFCGFLFVRVMCTYVCFSLHCSLLASVRLRTNQCVCPLLCFLCPIDFRQTRPGHASTPRTTRRIFWTARGLHPIESTAPVCTGSTATRPLRRHRR